MKLSDWSGRRIALMWIAGVSLQTSIVVLPMWLAYRSVRENRAAIVQQHADQEARWNAAEANDSASIAAQRREQDAQIGRTAGAPYAIVSTPSGRPDPQDMERAKLVMSRIVRIIYSIIPALLVLITAAWYFIRRREPQPPHTASA